MLFIDRIFSVNYHVYYKRSVRMSSQIGSGSAKGLIEFLDQLVEKGRAVSGSVVPLKSAVKQILSTIDGNEKWQEIDVRSLDVDDYMERFGNLTMGRYSADSLVTYRSRLQKALDWYGKFLTQPGWAPPKTRTSTKDRSQAKSGEAKKANGINKAPIDAENKSMSGNRDEQKNNMQNQSDLISYPFPLRPGKVVNLYLPIDLTVTEARRLGRFLESISVDSAPDNSEIA